MFTPRMETRNWVRGEVRGSETSAENQSSLSKMNKSKPQLKGSKQRMGTSNSRQGRTNQDI